MTRSPPSGRKITKLVKAVACGSHSCLCCVRSALSLELRLNCVPVVDVQSVASFTPNGDLLSMALWSFLLAPRRHQASAQLANASGETYCHISCDACHVSGHACHVSRHASERQRRRRRRRLRRRWRRCRRRRRWRGVLPVPVRIDFKAKVSCCIRRLRSGRAHTRDRIIGAAR